MATELQPRPMSINGEELACIEQGAGELVVFVHGSLGDYRDWGDQLAPFAERYRAVAYSRRRHWPNAWPTDGSGYRAVVHAADLAALIATLGSGPAHLVSHSYGALVALLVAAERPELVRSLVLGEPPLLPWLEATPDGRGLLTDFSAGTWEPARAAFGRGDLEAGVRRFLDGVVGEGAFDHLPPPVRDRVMDNAAEMRLEVVTPPEEHLSTFSPADAQNVRAPVLLLTGELSPPLLRRITDELARCLPVTERVVIPGVSHDLGNPPVFNAAVLGFLANH